MIRLNGTVSAIEGCLSGLNVPPHDSMSSEHYTEGVSRKQEITRNEQQEGPVSQWPVIPRAIMSLHRPMSDPGVTTGHQPHRMTRPGLLSLDLPLSPPLQLSLNFTTINSGRPGRAGASI